MPKESFDQAAEAAYDELAAVEGVDEFGDEIADDDGPESDVEEPISEDSEEPEVGGEDTEGEGTEGEEQAEPVEDQAEIELGGSQLAPHTWPEKWKEVFKQIPPAGQQAMLSLNTDMNQGFARRMAEVNQTQRELGGVRNVMEPHVPRLQRAGITPETAIARALQWDAIMQTDPVQGAREYARAYGVSLEQLAPPSDSVYMTPEERAQQQQFETMQSSMQTQQQQYHQLQQRVEISEQQRMEHAVDTQLNEFVNAKSPDGKLAHPHIDRVAPMMSMLMTPNQMGQVVSSDLEDAYQRAVAMDPELQAALEQDRQAADLRAQQDKVASVRKASNVGIVSKSSNRSGSQRGFEDQLSQTFDKLAHR